MYPTDEITKQLIEQRIAQFEAESAADYADAMELVSELEAAEAEQARLAAVDARIAELENAIEAAENGDQAVDLEARRAVEFDSNAGVCMGVLDGLVPGDQFALYPINERPGMRGVPARIVMADADGKLNIPLHATSCYRVCRVDEQRWLRFQAVGDVFELPAILRTLHDE